MPQHELIDWSVVDPLATAVVVDGVNLPYSRFQSDVDLFHAQLLRCGCEAGLRVGVVFKHEYWNWVAHVAATQAGTAVLSLRDRDGTEVARAFAVDVVLCDEPLSHLPVSFPVICQNFLHVEQTIDLVVHTPLIQGGKRSLSASEEASPISRLILTSGTTGRSRSVAWNLNQTLQRVNQVGEGLVSGPQTRLYSFQHIGTTGGFRYPLATWRLGGTVFLRGLSVAVADTWPCLSQCNVLTLAPANLRMVMNQWPAVWPGQSERHLILSGGRVSAGLRDEALARVGSRMSLAYGSTEAGSAATGDAVLIDRHPGAVGYVRDQVALEIVDDSGQAQPTGTPGIVRIRTPYMVQAYEQQSATSSDAFRDGWFYPGDQGVLDAHGFLSILGRLGDVVNLGGAKVSIPDMEHRLEGIPGVLDFCLVALPLPDGDRLAVVVVPKGDAPSTPMHDWIKKTMRRRLPYLLLRTDKIERNEMGKVPRAALSAKLLPMVIRQLEKQKR